MPSLTPGGAAIAPRREILIDELARHNPELQANLLSQYLALALMRSRSPFWGMFEEPESPTRNRPGGAGLSGALAQLYMMNNAFGLGGGFGI